MVSETALQKETEYAKESARPSAKELRILSGMVSQKVFEIRLQTALQMVYWTANVTVSELQTVYETESDLVSAKL
jgi:hypothetical protein